MNPEERHVASLCLYGISVQLGWWIEQHAGLVNAGTCKSATDALDSMLRAASGGEFNAVAVRVPAITPVVIADPPATPKHVCWLGSAIRVEACQCPACRQARAESASTPMPLIVLGQGDFASFIALPH